MSVSIKGQGLPTEEQKKDFQEAFRLLGMNADGSLSGDAAGAVLEAANPTFTLVQRMQLAAIGLRLAGTAPNVPQTQPVITSGNRYYIDPLSSNASDGGAGTSNAPWVNFHKLSGLAPGAGGVIHVAADAVFDYADTWTVYKAAGKFPYNSSDNLNGSSVAPVTIRPYYPRGATKSRPVVRWYALMQAADWTQEAGYGGNVWSAAWAKTDNNYRKTVVAYGLNDKIAEAPGHDQNAPALLAAPGQYAVDSNKIYLFSPGGVNPVSYYGRVKILGGNSIFGTSWNGLRFVKILGLQFELCRVVNLDFASDAATVHGGVELAHCYFRKSAIGTVRNQQTHATPQELPFSVHHCGGEDLWGGAIQLNTSGVGNTISWEVFLNYIDGCNLNSGFGAFVYNQAKGGTKKIGWGNYVRRAQNGIGAQVDGSAFYNDLGSNSGSFVGNVIEESGVPIQMNSATGGLALANLFIDCWTAAQITGTGTDNTPNMVANILHNTWLWTGRIKRTDLRLGSQIGATSAVFAHWNDQWLAGGRKFANYSLVNNLAVNASYDEMTRPMLRYEGNGITTLAVGGNAVLGLSGPQALNVNNSVVVDVTLLNEFITLRGELGDAEKWLSGAGAGSAGLTTDSPLIGAGISLSEQYQDIAGKNFAKNPTPGCLEGAA